MIYLSPKLIFDQNKMYFQHNSHLEGLLKETQSLSASDLHDSGVRTLCISEAQKVDLEKVNII